jgi:hypothetical protein
MTTHTPLRCANSVMAADPGASAGSRVVLLDTGNYPSFSSFLNETWTFSGTDWTNTSATLVNANGPLPGRTDMCMSYDGYNVMMFGGKGGSSAAGAFEDTWLWSGTAWTQAAPVTVPFARWNTACAYLVGTGVVMFGGENTLNRLLETWVWNGNTQTWSLLSLANGASPNARTGHVMASTGSSVLLFGGDGDNSQFNDTWTFAAGAWTKQAPTASPSVRSGACMSYDGYGSVYVLFGGRDEYNYLPETWLFGGSTWTKVAVANGAGPSARVGAQMCFDSQSNRTILFGGVNATTNYPANDTWSFNALSGVWTQL